MEYCKCQGSRLTKEDIRCSKCGLPLEELYNGEKMRWWHIYYPNESVGTAISVDLKKKTKVTAIILCCLGFIGVGGIHKFYEGKIGTGF